MMNAAEAPQAPVHVSCDAVTRLYRDRRSGEARALGPLDARIFRREFVSLVGPPSCGKTTLLRLVAGLDRPASGCLRILGSEVSGPQPGVGIMLEDPFLLDWRTPLGNIMLEGETRGLDRKAAEARARRLAAALGLDGVARRPAGELARPDRVRISLCRALAHDPSLVLLDDPFRHLDALDRERVALDLEREWLERRPTVLLGSDSLAEAVALADRVLVMSPAPARIAYEVRIDLPRPRRFDRATTPRIVEYCQRIRTLFRALGALP